MSFADHRCLVVDDSPTVGAAVRAMLEDAGLTVVDTVTTLEEAVEAARRHAPDVVLVDVDLGGESGFDVVEALHRAEAPQRPAVVLVSTHDPADFAEMVEASSAIGFLPKFGLSADLVLETVERGRAPARDTGHDPLSSSRRDR